MKRMKTMLSIFLATAMILMLAACGGGGEPATSGSNDVGGNQQSSQTEQKAPVKEETVFPDLTPLVGWDYDSVNNFLEENSPKELKEYYELRKALHLEHEYTDDESFHYMINREQGVACVQYYIGSTDVTEIVVPAEVDGCRVIYFSGEIPKSATSLILPEGLLGIHGAAYNAEGLISITFPKSLLIIDSGSFNYCASVKELNLPDSLIIINDGFERVGISELTIPNNTIYINGFNFCDSLTTIEFDGNNTLAISSSFVKCTQLVNCEIPDSVKYIRSTAFRDTSIAVPEELILAED